MLQIRVIPFDPYDPHKQNEWPIMSLSITSIETSDHAAQETKCQYNCTHN